MNEFSAWAATRADSVRVRATEGGVPTSVFIAPDELHYDSAELAATVLDLCRRATQSAKAQRRTQLEGEGMDADVLDRLGLPRTAAVARVENELMDAESAPDSWMKSV